MAQGACSYVKEKKNVEKALKIDKHISNENQVV